MANARGSEKRKMYKGWSLLTGDVAKAEKERLVKRAENAAKNSGGRVTNASFAATDTEFRNACEKVGIPASTRQASKWLRKKGLAYNKGR